MSYSRETKVGVGPAPQKINETLGGGPVAGVNEPPAYQYKQSTSQLRPRSRMERIGFWLIVLAALVVVLVLSGIILPPVVGGIITASYMAFFVGSLTLLNLRRPSGWANSVMGRRVFPVLTNTSDSEVWRLAGVNAALVFFFSFIYHVLASTFVGGFLAGLIVIIAFVALGVFYNRARKVVIKP
jgi:cytochrome b subunit of formate dehydrogenase